MASISFANTHIHNNSGEHTDCVKCFVHDSMSSADVQISVPSVFEYQVFEPIFPSPIQNCQKYFFTSFHARAPPYYKGNSLF